MKNLNTVSKPLINKILQVTAVTQVQFHNHDKYHSNPHCQHKNKQFHSTNSSIVIFCCWHFKQGSLSQPDILKKEIKGFEEQVLQTVCWSAVSCSAWTEGNGLGSRQVRACHWCVVAVIRIYCPPPNHTAQNLMPSQSTLSFHFCAATL